MARPAYSDKERKEIEAKIRAAALALFREVGYRGVTLRAVAKQLGWSAPALYRYYDNKESLMAAIRADGFIEMQNLLAAVRKDTADGANAAANAIRAYLRFAVEKPELYQLMYELDQGDLAELPVVYEERRKAFGQAEAIAADILRETGRKGDPNQLAHLFWIGVHGLAALQVASQLDLGADCDDLIEPVVQMILRGTLPAETENV